MILRSPASILDELSDLQPAANDAARMQSVRLKVPRTQTIGSRKIGTLGYASECVILCKLAWTCKGNRLGRSRKEGTRPWRPNGLQEDSRATNQTDEKKEWTSQGKAMGVP